MKIITRCAVVALVVSAPALAGAKVLMKPEIVVGMIAEAQAWGDLCRNWTVDSDAVDTFLLSQDMRFDDRYRELYEPARERAEAAVAKSSDARAACDHVLELYGPQGRKMAGLIKPKRFD